MKSARMRRFLAIAFVLVLCAGWFSGSVLASSDKAAKEKDQAAQRQDSAQTKAKSELEEDSGEDVSITHHSITINGQPLRYTATAGRLKIRDASGKPKASIFFTAYTMEGEAADGAVRPVAFAFNGGPGASSAWLHLGALGPKVVPTESDGRILSPPPTLRDNPNTWLTFTDLVFIDPVGTGFSRPAEGEDAKQFYGVRQDTEAMGAFIQRYCTTYQRWLSPKFLVGESYGTTRAAGLSGYLQDHWKMLLNGVVLISPVLNFETISFHSGNDLPYLLYLPAYTATAWYHNKLSPELEADFDKTVSDAEAWALTHYNTALAKGDALSEAERSSLIDRMAAFTGLSKDFIDRSNLRVDQGRFCKELLRGERRTVGRLDSRLEGIDSDLTGESPEYDTILFVTAGAYGAAMRDYVQRELNYRSDLPYEVLSSEVNQHWDWSSGISGRQGYVDESDTLGRAMTKNPALRLFIAAGYYDLGTPYFATEYTISHLGLDASLRSHVTLALYKAGHQMYTHLPSLERLHTDASAFFRGSALAGQK